MKIGIDGLALTIPNPCGTKLYAEQLLKALALIDKKNQYIIFSKKEIQIPIQRNFSLTKIPTKIPILKRQFFLAYMAKKANVDVFHFLEPVGALFNNGLKIVTTVHDLNLNYTYPFNKYLLKRLYCEFFRWFTLKNSNQIITDTNYISQELEKYFTKCGWSKKIATIHLGCQNIFQTQSISRKSFFLARGDHAPRKNVDRIIEAYSLLPEYVKNRYRLKVIASTKSAKRNFLEFSRYFDVKARVEVIDSVNEEELVRLYNRAICYVYPSLYEGFGLPILEAMACSCPVITSNYGAMKEVAGGAAYLVNPESTQQISKAMLELHSNNGFRKVFINAGLKRKNFFSWNKTAMETLRTYREVYSEK